MKLKSLFFIAVLLLVGIITFAFIRIPKDNSNSFYAKKTDSIKPQIDQRTGKILFDISEEKIIPQNQNLFYLVRSKSNQRFFRPITREKLSKAKSISDLIENYPSTWIKDYNSVQISTTENGEEIITSGPNETLTKDQKQLFKTASNLNIIVNYQKKNHDEKIQNRQMEVSLVVTPKKQAEYKGGYDKMITYLRENSINQIIAKNLGYLPKLSIDFVINSTGKTESVDLNKSSGNDDIDGLLIKLVQNMPEWNPAINEKGENVQQKFTLDIGEDNC